jgi:tetratricopeptide (TPR) repeat protein
VGSIGSDLRRDYTAEGVTVGMAARLEQLAGPGQVLVSEDCARRAGSAFHFTDLGARELRGVRRSVRVFELGSAASGAQRREDERVAGLAPFVGREAELAWLESEVPARGGDSPLLIEIRGEPGVGKSRLASEFLWLVRDRAHALEAACREEDANRAYAPWLALLRDWPAELPGADAASSLRAELQGAEPPPSRANIARRLAELFASAQRERPLVLLLEDVHWIDPSSRELVELLVAGASCGRLTLLSTLRAENEASPWGPACRRQLLLGPVDAHASRQIADAILQETADAEALVEFAARRGGGNPLFVEELARALREGGDELRSAARLEAALLRARVRVPDTLRGTIAARIDALAAQAKQFVEAAAVIDGPFDLALLRRVAAAEEEPLAHVAALVRSGILVRAQGVQFDVRHALVREVAYQQVLRSRRRELHLRCAEALVAAGESEAPDHASRIGWHYDRAGERDAAAAHLARAGQGFMALSAIPEAAAHLRRAWELEAGRPLDPAARASLGLELVTALNALDRAREAAEVLEGLPAEALQGGERRQIARVCIESGWVRFSRDSDVAAGRALIERGLELVGADPAGDSIAAAGHAHLCRLYAQDGEPARAAEHAKRLIEAADRLSLPVMRSFGLASWAYALCDAGQIAEARPLADEAVAVAERIDNPVALALACAFGAKVRLYAGDAPGALEIAARGRAVGEGVGQLGSVHVASAWAAHAWLLQDEPHRAQVEVERCAASALHQPELLLLRAQVSIARGRHDAAVALAHECLAQSPPRLSRIRALRALGLGLALGGAQSPYEGAKRIEEALGLAKQLGLRPELAESELALGVLWSARTGESARPHLERAAREFQACAMPLHAERARRLLDASR